jgi:hypothetical protein
MASLRQTYLLAWDGKPAVKVQTNARDMANAQELAENQGKAIFSLLHSALERNGHDVPDLETWIDQLDEMEQVTEVVMDPTPVAESTNGLSPSPWPQAPISISG